MNLFIIALVSVLSLVLFILTGIFAQNKKFQLVCFGASTAFSIIILLSTILLVTSNEIPAIEVYRGNTTLQITYEDSMPVDSVVVYKKKNK